MITLRTFTALAATCLISFGAAEAAHACSSYGAIAAKWQQLGGYNSPVGPCVDDEHDDGAGGRIQTFRAGFIDWDGHTAYAVYGLIGQKWNLLGQARWGHPTTDELGAPDGFGRYSWFRNSAGAPSTIYFNPRSYYCAHSRDCEAYVVFGSILNEWARLGYERSQLGYPTADEKAYTEYGNRPGERISTFDNGFIRWRPDGSLLSKLGNGRCLNETGTYLDDQSNGIRWCY